MPISLISLIRKNTAGMINFDNCDERSQKTPETIVATVACLLLGSAVGHGFPYYSSAKSQ